MSVNWTIRNVVYGSLALSISAGSAIPATAEASLWMKTGSVTSQPIGHYEFCLQYVDECTTKFRSAAPPQLTQRGWQVIREINSSVNASIAPITDEDLYGKDEVWVYPTNAGDCEDYALLKRRTLIEQGFSAADLLMTVLLKPDGEGHAVVTVRTSEGDFILDNLEEQVLLWSKTPYTFLKRQASFNSGRWVTIENGQELAVGSVKE